MSWAQQTLDRIVPNDFGVKVLTDFNLDPFSAAVAILSQRPELIPTLPPYRIPDFGAFTPLAEMVGANPGVHLGMVAGLEQHRAAISDALSTGAMHTMNAAVRIVDIAFSVIPETLAAIAAASGGGFLAQAAAAAGVIGLKFTEAADALRDLKQGLDNAAARLNEATARATAVPVPGDGRAGTRVLEEIIRTVTRKYPALGPVLEALGVIRPAAAPERAPGKDALRLAEAPPPPGANAAPAGSTVGQRAVEAAKSQLGTPYVWGGSAPGGFDCSGLTSWAYKQAGLQIPRVAENQTVGRQVSFQELQPGDLVLWSGHAAMYAGDGMMIEAGNPVQMSPVRTTNIGMPFKGFWRPSEAA